MGKMDPYVILEHAGKVYQTPAIKEGGQIPEWNYVIPEDFKFKGAANLGETTIFKMKCMDDDYGKDDEVGTGTFKLSQICGSKLEGTPSLWVKLMDEKGKLVSEIEIETKFKVNPPASK